MPDVRARRVPADASGPEADLVRQLVGETAGGASVSPALFLPEVPLENELRDRDALPEALPRALSTAADALLARQGVAPQSGGPPLPRRVTPGALGQWSGERS